MRVLINVIDFFLITVFLISCNNQEKIKLKKFQTVGEIERLDKQVGSVKELYFNSKQNQVIYEDMEGEQMGEMDDAQY
jgi:hypothetical protein